MSSTDKENLKENGIVEVYAHNFISEIKRLSQLLEEFPYVGMDTEFPGTVYCTNSYTPDFYYKTLKINVDSLKLIQIGITLSNSKGEHPQGTHTWQFNLNFNYKKDKYSASSYSLLCDCGIDFEKLKKEGIDYALFAEYFFTSGLVLNEDVTWVSFHGSYDFGYLLKLLLNSPLPLTERDFLNELTVYFPRLYDIKILVQGIDKLQGGLNRLASVMDVKRFGKTHQAGSDSAVTIDLFFKLIQSTHIDTEVLEEEKNIIFGLGLGADESETLSYTKFANGMVGNNLYMLYPQQNFELNQKIIEGAINRKNVFNVNHTTVMG